MDTPTTAPTDVPVTTGVYNPLGPTEIRLVEILPGAFDDPIDINISVVDLKNDPVYDALSYVWHAKDGTVDTKKPLGFAIVLNNDSYRIPIGANLEAAIRYLRFPSSQTSGAGSGQILWIDALCINQDLLSERNHQVGLMKSIYSSAKQVLIWLGPPQNCSNLVVEVMRTGDLESYILAGTHIDLKSIRLAGFLDNLELLLRRHWFGRVWYVLQYPLLLDTKGLFYVPA
ncbi:hypothetical protein HBI56_048710 [Parastagonospora nodorum]|uniref:Heterokaryon incompatibility domain-containing protein n=1 Tax=Phaeosphaeria nodorum (strain SN15 / ATCC MYA-4574 / FGSC 10173) TaxID=321614 RepID=A0A7U2HVM3_PHANO|nr:hypothetical protein HBH56_061630 [Parastagonospora nodorum]QRC91994.1 hypothetical protein JI435_021590 [Parastagonospora nodorum SN15]KAH3930848.1 hypothetical protein HBH54_105570 [Parastagonospora nodorum]KAH3977230.1 hypothetical protein HBH52_114670 [Parastagonospora nodorum]KAH4074045.1 hypothetical protein HBH50_041900 [Parastagonospora nodorum]